MEYLFIKEDKSMKTYLDCIPCLVKQALKAGREALDDEKLIKDILDQAGDLIKTIPMESTPVETAGLIYGIVRKVTGVYDPYKKIKDRTIKDVIKLKPFITKKIDDSHDRLLTAVRVAIAGNVIDLGVEKKFNIKEDLEKILVQDFSVFDFKEFQDKVKNANSILYIGDNCGESVFDKFLIREMDKPVYYAVRETPVINDVTYDEAVSSGLDEVSTIISSGVDTPGTILSKSNKDFLKIFNESDLVISKGQGNYEGLSGSKRDIFFLLKAKCHVIANDIGVKEDDIVLKGINI